MLTASIGTGEMVDTGIGVYCLFIEFKHLDSINALGGQKFQMPATPRGRQLVQQLLLDEVSRIPLRLTVGVEPRVQYDTNIRVGQFLDQLRTEWTG